MIRLPDPPIPEGDQTVAVIMVALLIVVAAIIGRRQWRESMTIYRINLALRPDERMASSNALHLALIGLAVAIVISVAAIWGVRL